MEVKLAELSFLFMEPLNVGYIARFNIAVFWYDTMLFGT
jgi:hypothetical protein